MKRRAKQYARAKARAKTIRKPTELHLCLCGCGERIPGRYKQGHGARLYAQYKQVLNGRMSFDELPTAVQARVMDVSGVRRELAAAGFVKEANANYNLSSFDY